MDVNIPTSKVIKPYYNARIANNMQKASDDLNKSIAQLNESILEKQMEAVKKINESGFTTIKSKSTRNREEVVNRRKFTKEFLVEYATTLVYGALPLDSDFKEPYKQVIHDTVLDRFNSDPSIMQSIGDRVTRTGYVNFGNDDKLNSNLMQLINSRYDKTVSSRSPHNEHGRYSAQDFIDITSTSDLPTSMNEEVSEEDKILIESIDNALDETLELLTERVRHHMVATMKNEAEIIDKDLYIQEQIEIDSNYKQKNKTIARLSNKTSLFREMFKNIKLMNEMTSESTDEEYIAETLVELTIMECFNTLGIKKYNEEDVIKNLQSERSKFIIHNNL
jgi:hypothetical protein